jgi:hypothetical protein
MELFTPLSKFYNAIEKDARINTTHISLYMALLQQWNSNGGKKTMKVKRTDLMKLAKINARYTYNKYINDLKEFGYINYSPSSNQFNLSDVSLVDI